MGSTHKLLSKLSVLSGVEVGGIPGVAVEMCIRDSIYVHNEIAELRKAVRWCNRREPIQEEYIP